MRLINFFTRTYSTKINKSVSNLDPYSKYIYLDALVSTCVLTTTFGYISYNFYQSKLSTQNLNNISTSNISDD